MLYGVLSPSSALQEVPHWLHLVPWHSRTYPPLKTREGSDAKTPSIKIQFGSNRHIRGTLMSSLSAACRDAFKMNLLNKANQRLEEAAWQTEVREASHDAESGWHLQDDPCSKRDIQKQWSQPLTLTPVDSEIGLGDQWEQRERPWFLQVWKWYSGWIDE